MYGPAERARQREDPTVPLWGDRTTKVTCFACPPTSSANLMCMAYFDTFEQMAPHFFFHAQLIDFGLPGVQGLLPQLRADDDPLTLHLRCASGAWVEDCAPETLRQYSLRSKGTVMSTTPVS